MNLSDIPQIYKAAETLAEATGKTTEEILTLLDGTGTGTSRSSNTSRRYHVARRTPSRGGMTEKIRALAKKGYTAKEIAPKVGISRSGVQWQARRHGIKLKRQPPGPTGGSKYWASMTTEQRSAEMRRRRLKALGGSQ